MKSKAKKNAGIRLLVEHYRKMFRIPENLNYYTENDYSNAERHFIKMALQRGKL